MRLTNFIKEHAEDIRNNINEAVKYYTPKQAVKILQQNLAEIPEYDDKCIAVYKALDFHYSDLGSSKNKLVIKSYDEYERYPSGDRQYNSRAKKFDDFKDKLFSEYIDNSKIKSMYNQGKELIKKQEELEAQKKREAEELAKSKLYKETVEKYPGLHEMVKFQKIYDFWRNNHLWTVVKKGESFGGFIEELINKYSSKAVEKKDCEPGKVYVLAAGQPNLYNAKDWYGKDAEAPNDRYNIILKGSVLKCVGDGVFDVVAGLTYYGYSYEEWNKKTLNQKLDQDCGFILLSDFEKDFKERGKELTDKWAKDILDDDKKNGDIWPASPWIKKLIEKDTL